MNTGHRTTHLCMLPHAYLHTHINIYAIHPVYVYMHMHVKGNKRNPI